jgi:FkbM family methyltransferase
MVAIVLTGMGVTQKIRDISRPARRFVMSAIGALGYELSRKDEHGRIVFSADGEDAIALSWLCDHFGLRKQDIRYLDVGAGHPCQLSNTFLMYRWGARGVLVEPDPDQVRKLRAKRPRDLVIQAGIAFDNKRSGTLCRYENRLFNSLISSRDQTWSGPIADRIEIPLMPINDVISLSGTTPHFISIDTEGLDYEIVASIDFDRFRPFVICVELCRPAADFLALLGGWGYEPIVRTTYNALFALMERSR